MWTVEIRALVGDLGAGQALSDEQFALLEPMIPPARPGGRPRTTDMRRLLDGLFYLVRTGCQWRYLPGDLPPKSTVWRYFDRWRREGTLDTIHDALPLVARERAAYERRQAQVLKLEGGR